MAHSHELRSPFFFFVRRTGDGFVRYFYVICCGHVWTAILFTMFVFIFRSVSAYSKLCLHLLWMYGQNLGTSHFNRVAANNFWSTLNLNNVTDHTRMHIAHRPSWISVLFKFFSIFQLLRHRFRRERTIVLATSLDRKQGSRFQHFIGCQTVNHHFDGSRVSVCAEFILIWSAEKRRGKFEMTFRMREIKRTEEGLDKIENYFWNRLIDIWRTETSTKIVKNIQYWFNGK